MKTILVIIFLLVTCFALPFSTQAYLDEGSGQNGEAETKPESRMKPLLPKVGGVAHLGYTFNSRSDLKDTSDNDIALHIIDIGTKFPFELNQSTRVTVGGEYRVHMFRIQNLTNYYQQSGKTLHHISNPIELLFLLGRDWSLDVNFTQIIASDFDRWDGSDYQFAGHITGGWAFSDAASVFFGVGVGKDFWRYFPYPILGLVYRPEEGLFNMEMMLPDYARFNFKVANYLTLFAAGEFEGLVWDVTGEGTIPDHFVKFYDSRAGGGAQFKIVDGLFIEAWGGLNPWRRFEYRNNVGAKITHELDMGYFAKAQFVVTPSLFGW